MNTNTTTNTTTNATTNTTTNEREGKTMSTNTTTTNRAPMAYTDEVQQAIHTMSTAVTPEEITAAYHAIIRKCHPDNIGTAADIDLIVRLTTCRNRNLAKIANRLEQWEREQAAGREQVKRLPRHFANLDELLNSGAELPPVLQGMIIKVSRVFSGKLPTPNRRQITDKTHADKYGNFDGVRTYPWAGIIWNKARKIDADMMDEAIQETTLQLLKNKNLPQYDGLDVSVLVWIAARQALNNIYYNTVKKPSMLQTVSLSEAKEAAAKEAAEAAEKGRAEDQTYAEYLTEKARKKDDVFNLQAYENAAPFRWETAEAATLRVYMATLTRSPFERKVIRKSEAGYTQAEIAKEYGVSQKTISNVIERVYNRLLCDRMTARLDHMEMKKTRETARYNDAYLLRVWIMAGVRAGMSYDKIADALNIADAHDKNGNTTTTKAAKIARLLKDPTTADDLITVRLNPATLPRVPSEYTNGHTQNSTGQLREYWTTRRAEASRKQHAAAMQAAQEAAQAAAQAEKERAEELTRRAEAMRIWREYEAEKDGFRVPDAEQFTPEPRTEWGNGKNTWLEDITRKIAQRERRDRYFDYQARRRHELFEQEEAAEA